VKIIKFQLIIAIQIEFHKKYIISMIIYKIIEIIKILVY